MAQSLRPVLYVFENLHRNFANVVARYLPTELRIVVSVLQSITSPLCMVTEDVVTILKGVSHFPIQRTVFPTGATMLIFGH